MDMLLRLLSQRRRLRWLRGLVGLWMGLQRVREGVRV